MRFAPELAGPRRPLESTPSRPAGSVRRTSSIDVVQPEGPGGVAVVDARGRDLRTGADGAASVEREARFAAALDVARVLTSIEACPPDSQPAGLDLTVLVGAAVSGGFRKRVAEAAAGDAASGGLWHLLLDDLVGATLVSGVAQQHAEVLAGGGPMHEGIYADVEGIFGVQAGVCAGWATDASMLRVLRETGELPVPIGPAAPVLEVADDSLGWHETEPLAPHSVRRRRRVDLGPPDGDGTAPIDVHFRDSHVDPDGVERCVHEYVASGRVDAAVATLVDLEVEARVLPWEECPRAVDSAQRAVGAPLGHLRDLVRAEFRGVSTCTHLNDLVRSLADLRHLR